MKEVKRYATCYNCGEFVESKYIHSIRYQIYDTRSFSYVLGLWWSYDSPQLISRTTIRCIKCFNPEEFKELYKKSCLKYGTKPEKERRKMLVVYWQGKAVGGNKRLKWTPKRMVANKDYQDFIDSMAWQLKLHREHFPGRVDVKLELTLWACRDSDSVIKPCLDALQRSGVLSDDNQVRDIAITRKYHKRGEPDRIGFCVEEVEEDKKKEA